MGRRKRSSTDQEDGDVGSSPGNELDHHLSIDPHADMRYGTSDQSPESLEDKPHVMEEIKFVLNGKEERFVVAKEVEALVDHFPDEDDSDFGL